jgi:hypothetical protein
MRYLCLLTLAILTGCAASDSPDVRLAATDDDPARPAVDVERAWPYEPPAWSRDERTTSEAEAPDRADVQVVEFCCQILRFAPDTPALEARLALAGLMHRQTAVLNPQQVESLLDTHLAAEDSTLVSAPRILTWLGQRASVQIGSSGGPGMRFYVQATDIVDDQLQVRFACQSVESVDPSGHPRAWQITGDGPLTDGSALATFLEATPEHDPVVVLVQAQGQHE